MRLEKLLDLVTGDDGIFVGTNRDRREIFNLAWMFVDQVHSLLTLSKTKMATFRFLVPGELETDYRVASIFRNYMDHLSQQLKNLSTARDFAPLFGWLSYQFAPYFRDPRVGLKHFLMPMIASSILPGNFQSEAGKASALEVFGLIDNIVIHIRRADRLNISRMFANTTVLLNDWSLRTYQAILGKLQDDSYDHGGLLVPYPALVVRADLDPDKSISHLEMDSILKANNIRVDVQFDTPD
ncbi:MAG: hypothetical protein KJZ64_11195 [Sphingomonadaceae bacterium]|nr:hypothetical protein [Sphingomonadaceae bacterium]